MPTRVTDLSDPCRCKASAPDGQCHNVAVEGFDYCEVHGGRANAAAEGEKRLYHLTKAKYRNRLAQLSEHEQIKSLREEIAVTRMLIEARMNLIDTDADLLAACGPLNGLLLTADKLVKSAHQIEQNLGVLLAKPALMKLAQAFIEIIIDELAGIVDYERKIDRITERMLVSVTDVQNVEK